MQRLRLFFVYRKTGYMLIKIRHAGISVWRISYGFYSYPGPLGIYTWSSGDFGAAFVVSGTVSGTVSTFVEPMFSVSSSLGRTTEVELWIVQVPGERYLESSVPPDSPSGITMKVLVVFAGQYSVASSPDSLHTVSCT